MRLALMLRVLHGSRLNANVPPRHSAAHHTASAMARSALAVKCLSLEVARVPKLANKRRSPSGPA